MDPAGGRRHAVAVSGGIDMGYDPVAADALPSCPVHSSHRNFGSGNCHVSSDIAVIN